MPDILITSNKHRKKTNVAAANVHRWPYHINEAHRLGIVTGVAGERGSF